MKRKLFQKFAAGAASVCLTLSLLSGCGAPATTTSSTPPPPAGSTTPESTPAAPAEVTYPLATPVTLKYWTPIAANAASYYRDYSENPAYIEMEKRTGVDIEFVHPAAGQEVESFNVMMASGEYPDIINCGGGRYKGGEAAGVDDGVFADLTDYIPIYAPDYYKLVTSDPELNREVRDDKGRFVAMYKIKPVGDPPFRRVMFRTEWMKELGLTTPKTLADYEILLKALKETKKVTPMLLPKNGYEEQFMGMYGVRAGFYLKDGKNVAFGQIQPEFKQYLELMNKWYKAGYIGSDFPTMDVPMHQSQFDSGALGLIIDASVVTYNRDQMLGFEVDSCPYPKLNEGDKLHWDYADAFKQGGEITVVSAASKNIAEAVSWMNYGFTQEGADLLNYGVPDKVWTLKDGVPTFTEYALNNPDFPGGDANILLKVQFSAKLTYPDVDCSINLAKTPAARAMRMKWDDDPDIDSMFIVPPIKFTSDERTQQAKLMNDINTYCDEMTLKFITGTTPLSDWDSYVAQVKAMDVDGAVKIHQDAYDRYMS